MWESVDSWFLFLFIAGATVYVHRGGARTTLSKCFISDSENVGIFITDDAQVRNNPKFTSNSWTPFLAEDLWGQLFTPSRGLTQAAVLRKQWASGILYRRVDLIN